MRATRHGVEDEHLVVPIREGRIAGARSAFRHCAVYRRVERLEGLAETLGVPARQPGGSAALFVHDRGVAKQDLARAPTMAEPELVRSLRVPRRGRIGSVDLELERVLAARAH